MKTKVAVYFRCSTDKQDHSIADQRRILVEYAASHEMEITTWFDQDEGKSGTSFEKRPDFMRMVRLVESGQHDFCKILVYDIDRWGRPTDPAESAYWEFHLKRLGVQVVYIADPSVNADTLAGRLTKQIKQEGASDESRKQSLRVRERSKMRAAEGFRVGGSAPYGFKRQLLKSDGTTDRVLENGERKYEKSQRVILVPGDSSEMEVVQEMFKRKAAGQGIREIMEWLNRDRIPAPATTGRLNNRTNLPGKWGVNTVYKVLTNRGYIGTAVYNRQVKGSWAKLEDPGISTRDEDSLIVKRNAHQPIVSEQVFGAAQSSLKRARRGTRGRSWAEGPYLLTGLLTCTNCGYRYHGHSHKYNGKPYPYYEDSGYNLHGKSVCTQSMIPKDAIESFVIKAVSDTLLPSIDRKRLRDLLRGKIKRGRKDDSKADNMRLEIAQIDRKLGNIRASIENGVDLGFLKERIAILTRNRTELESELAQVESSHPPEDDPEAITAQIMELVDQTPAILASGATATVKPLLRNYVKSIDVDGKARKARCYLYRIPKVNGGVNSLVGKVMPEVGIEPTWYCYRRILSPLRLPISPLRHESSCFTKR